MVLNKIAKISMHRKQSRLRRQLLFRNLTKTDWEQVKSTYGFQSPPFFALLLSFVLASARCSVLATKYVLEEEDAAIIAAQFSRMQGRRHDCKSYLK